MGITLNQLKNTVTKIMTKVSNLNSVLNSAITDHKNNTTVHITEQERTTWNSILQSSKEYADNLLTTVNTFNTVICESSDLPTENLVEKTFYFVPKAKSETNNLYDEYIYINSKLEKIGEGVTLNLTDYAKKTDLDSYVSNDTLTSTLTDYAKKAEIDTTSYTDEEVNSAIDTILETF